MTVPSLRRTIGGLFAQYGSLGDDALLDVIAGRQLVHDVEHDGLDNGPQPARARAPSNRLFRDGLQRILVKLERHVVHVEQLLELLDDARSSAP